MKFNYICGAALAFLLLFLSGCDLPISEDTNDLFRKNGKIVLSTFLEIDEKAGELDFLEANDTLSLTSGITYASWIGGESSVYTSSDGMETELHDIEAYILLSECQSKEDIQPAIEQWIGLEAARYSMGEKKNITCSQKEYSYYELAPLDDSPYIYGIAAFSSHDNYALSVELMFGKASEKDKTEVLEDFLDAFHYTFN